MLLKLVSIIVPCYKQAQYLDEALQSVLDQTYQNWECIIVNDGSPDNTEQVAKKWLKKDNRFIYLDKENGGLSSARNLGINMAAGEFILTLDADDKYETSFIEKAMEIIFSNDEIGIVSSWGIRFKDNKQYGQFCPKGGAIKDFLFSNASIGTSLFRKKCWDEAGGYDENMKMGYEDWDFYIRVCQNGWSVHVIEEILFFYRQHTISMRTNALNKYDNSIKQYIYLKHINLYKENFEELITHLLEIAEINKKNEIKRIKSIDFRLGNFLLKPIRFIKKNLK